MEHKSFMIFYKFPITARLERYIDALREREYDKDRYFAKLCDDIDDVIEANNQLLAHLYAAKRSYMSVSVRTRRGGFGF